MGKTAFIFPGQGAQYVGMGKEFYDAFPDSRELFEKAEELLGLDLYNICFEDGERINNTEYTQAALVVVEAAIEMQLRKAGINPDVCAGLSLGEYTALISSGVMSFEDAVQVVRKRGIYMQDAVPLGEGTMAAVMGTESEKIEAVLEKCHGIVEIANYNSPVQIVISGETKAVEEAIEKLKEAGVRKCIPLKVSGPFHSSMLKGAGEKLGEELENVTVNEPEVPYVANINATIIDKKDQVKELLKNQVSSSVRWMQSVNEMIAFGVDKFVEIGPGKTLSAFVRKINRDVSVYHVESVADLDKLKEEFQC